MCLGGYTEDVATDYMVASIASMENSLLPRQPRQTEAEKRTQIKKEMNMSELEALRAQVAELQANVAALTTRDARRESEHISLMKIHGELAASRDRLRREMEEDYALLGKAVDQRIHELTGRIATSGGDSETLADWVADLSGKVVANQGRLVDRLIGRLEEMLDLHSKMLDRVERLERVLVPQLRA
jgi:hypothetical protein